MPTIRSFNHPSPRTPFSRMTINRNFHPAMRNMRDVAAAAHRPPNGFPVIPFIQTNMLLHLLRRRTWHNSRFKRISNPRGVMSVGLRQNHAEWDTVSVDIHVPFGSEFPSIRGIFPRGVPPFTGDDTVAPSATCQCQSMPLRSSYSSKQTRQIHSNTNARVHCWKCRWTVDPEPYSLGIIFHWHPVRSTYRIPSMIFRWSFAGHPPLGDCGSGGTNGAIFSHISSGKSRQPTIRGNGLRFSFRRFIMHNSSKGYASFIVSNRLQLEVLGRTLIT